MTKRTRSARGSGEQLRAEILDATTGLLTRTGNADNVSIRAIARLVGVSPPSIYRHFADKDALIDAACAAVFEDLEDVMRSAAIDAGAPMERIRLMGLAYVRFAREHPEQYRLATMLSARPTTAVDLVLGSAAFTHFITAIRESMDDGVLVPGDPVPVALTLWSAAHGIASLQITKPGLPWGDLDEIANRVMRAAWIGEAVAGVIGGDPSPAEFTAWLEKHRD